MNPMDTYKAMAIGDSAVFEMALSGRARKYAVANIVILGVLFGLSDMLGALKTTPNLPLDDKYMLITPLFFSAAGIVTMCGAVIGVTLVYWAAARAFGGPGGFGLILDLIGLAAIPFWILTPALNYALRFAGGDLVGILLTIIIIPAFFWSFRLIRQSLMTGQGLSPARSTIALAAMWIFSISSVYVYMP